MRRQATKTKCELEERILRLERDLESSTEREGTISFEKEKLVRQVADLKRECEQHQSNHASAVDTINQRDLDIQKKYTAHSAERQALEQRLRDCQREADEW